MVVEVEDNVLLLRQVVKMVDLAEVLDQTIIIHQDVETLLQQILHKEMMVVTQVLTLMLVMEAAVVEQMQQALIHQDLQLQAEQGHQVLKIVQHMMAVVEVDLQDLRELVELVVVELEVLKDTELQEVLLLGVGEVVVHLQIVPLQLPTKLVQLEDQEWLF